jgi:hypothetical protein
MEFGDCCDGVLVAPQMAATLGDGSIEILNGIEVFVDQRLIDKRPKMFGGLKLGAVGRQEDQTDSLGQG